MIIRVEGGYVCGFHALYTPVYDRLQGGHFRALPDDVVCDNCVPYPALCNEWLEFDGASRRCMYPADHDQAHLSETSSGSRYGWWVDAEGPRDLSVSISYKAIVADDGTVTVGDIIEDA